MLHNMINLFMFQIMVSSLYGTLVLASYINVVIRISVSTLHIKIIIAHICLKALNTGNACPIYYVEYMCGCVEYELYSRHYL